MDPEDEGNLGLEPADPTLRKLVPASMSSECNLGQDTLSPPSKLPHEAMAEPQTGGTEVDSDAPVKGPETSTPIKISAPSMRETTNEKLVSSLATSPSNIDTLALAPQHHTHLNITGSHVNMITGSHISGTQVSMDANGKVSEDSRDCTQSIKSPNPLSVQFSKAVLRCAKCLDEEGKLDDLKLVLLCWSCNDRMETLLPDAQAAKSVVQLFLKAMSKHLWHWLDFENLIQLLDTVSCDRAKKILDEYKENLLSFCENELSALIPYRKSTAPPTKMAFMDVKLNGDTENFKLKDLYKCKKFLVTHLGISSSAFVFYELFPGCVTMRWVVLTGSACAAIEAKSCAGSVQFLGAEMEIKLVRPVNPPRQNVPQLHVSQEIDVAAAGESLFFGNLEYVFSQRVPQYAQCPICLGILQNAVVTDCCHVPFCLDCCEKANQASRKCPICRHEDFQHGRVEFIDKQVVGNILARCCRCQWTGYLWNALSVESHPCVFDTKAPKEESQEITAEPTKTVGEARQEEATPMAVALHEAACVESQGEFVNEEKASLVSEKRPLLEAVQGLLSQLHALQVYVNDEAVLNSEEHLSSSVPGTLRDAVDEFTVLLQDMEENFLATEGSIVSGPSRRLSVAEGDVEEPHLCESMEGTSANEQTGAEEAAARAHSGENASVKPLESEMVSPRPDVRIPLQNMTGETFPVETPAQLVQAPEQFAAQTSLVRAAQKIMHLAAKAGQASLLYQLLIATEISPDHASYTGVSLLYIACQFGYIDMARMLITHGASVTFRCHNGQSPLHGAAYSGSLPCLKLLLEKEDTDVDAADQSGNTPLHTAAQRGHAAFARELTNHSHSSVNKANACGQTPLHCALQSSSASCEVVGILLSLDAIVDAVDEEGLTPIHTAVKEGNAEVVKVLLGSNANPNLASSEHRLTPLHTAARQAEGLQLIQLLHAAGADIAAHDQKGRSVLHHAVKSSSLEIVQTVVEMGCPIDDIAQENFASSTEQVFRPYQGKRNPVMFDERKDTPTVEDHIQSGGTTPLHLAILSRKADIVQFLLSKGADVHKTTRTGCAAIHMAVRSGDASLVKEMVATGCNTDLKTHDGFSPLHLAAQWGHKDVAMELIKAGCNKEQLTGGKRKSKALTALLIAAMKHRTDTVQSLAEVGCQVQATTADGHNAIHLAVIAADVQQTTRDPFYAHTRMRQYHSLSDAIETISLLARLGCDINAMNVDGLSPLDLAVTQRGYRYRSFEDVEFGYGWRSSQLSVLDHTLRRFGALTSRELRRKAAFSQTLDDATESVKGIESKLAGTLKSAGSLKRGKRLYRQSVGNVVPSSYDLSRYVVPHVSHFWRDIGISLDLDPNQLDEAVADCSGDDLECCMKVFSLWLNGEGKGPKTWNTVLDVLQMVGHQRTAALVVQQLHMYH